jgi:CIC family chloride channel protein
MWSGCGMAAIFASPVSAVILVMELLLFEFRPRSIIPVALASVTATSIRYIRLGAEPIFHMPDIIRPTGEAMCFYIALGALMGLAAVAITKLLYWIEDAYTWLPMHWMWYPALGGLAVGGIGSFAPQTLGVGYENIEQAISGELVGSAALFLCVMKFASWSIALGSGTSGGTLAPLFTIGGALGALVGGLAASWFPTAQINVGVSALIGMAAIFAGASRALLSSVVFAFETTLQPMGLLPLLGGCSASYLISAFCMKNTIMTEKIVRRGVRVPAEYSADIFDQILVREVYTRQITILQAEQNLLSVREWIASGQANAQHQGFPVVDHHNHLLGVVTRRDLLESDTTSLVTVREIVKRPPIVIHENRSLREAVNLMVRENVGRLPVVDRHGNRLLGILTRGDVLSAQLRQIEDNTILRRHIQILSKVRGQISGQVQGHPRERRIPDEV